MTGRDLAALIMTRMLMKYAAITFYATLMVMLANAYELACKVVDYNTANCKQRKIRLQGSKSSESKQSFEHDSKQSLSDLSYSKSIAENGKIVIAG